MGDPVYVQLLYCAMRLSLEARMRVRLEREAASPVRLMHWRWAFAGQLAQERRRSFRFDLGDPWLEEAVAYQLAKAGRGHRDHRRRLSERFRDIVAAEAIFFGGGKRRAVLEAWLATGAPAEEIAIRNPLETATVKSYESLFFAISEWQNALDGVLAAVQRSVRQLPDGLGSLSMTLRQLALFGGPLVLEPLLGVFDDCLRIRQHGPAVRREIKPSIVTLGFLVSDLEPHELGLRVWQYLCERSEEYRALKADAELLEQMLKKGALYGNERLLDELPGPPASLAEGWAMGGKTAAA